MPSKTILLIDDEQTFLEPLADALEFEGHRVLTATTGEQALNILAEERIDLVTIDVMMDPGASLAGEVDSHTTGIFLCETMRQRYPNIDAFCISVINEPSVIRHIQSCGVRFLRKGETPLRTVLNMIRSRLTGIAYDSDRDKRGQWGRTSG